MFEVAAGLVVAAERRGQHPEVVRRGTHADERGVHRDDAVTERQQRLVQLWPARESGRRGELRGDAHVDQPREVA